jgi:hypothetical protein
MTFVPRLVRSMDGSETSTGSPSCHGGQWLPPLGCRARRSQPAARPISDKSGERRPFRRAWFAARLLHNKGLVGSHPRVGHAKQNPVSQICDCLPLTRARRTRPRDPGSHAAANGSAEPRDRHDRTACWRSSSRPLSGGRVAPIGLRGRTYPSAVVPNVTWPVLSDTSSLRAERPVAAFRADTGTKPSSSRRRTEDEDRRSGRVNPGRPRSVGQG